MGVLEGHTVREEGSRGGLVKERFDFPIMLHFFPPQRRVNSHTAYVIKKSSNVKRKAGVDTLGDMSCFTCCQALRIRVLSERK